LRLNAYERDDYGRRREKKGRFEPKVVKFGDLIVGILFRVKAIRTIRKTMMIISSANTDDYGKMRRYGTF
jgi:hypothetical protein